tara:strand:+ start:3207 stop:3590 length:384 start_codon:yes stop_codon:yes gene_type:complete
MAYTIDFALAEHYEQYKWSLYNSDYDTLEWDEENAIPKPTKEDLESKLAVLNASEPMKRLRYERDRLLSDCDWVVTKAIETGVAETEAWKTYRQALRDLPSTQTPVMEEEPTTNLGIKNVTWPTKPS